MQISRNTATCMRLSMSMQSCIQAQHLYLLSLPQSVFFVISASLLLFDCIITLYLIFTKRITVLYNIPHPQGRLNLLVSPERRENSVFQQLCHLPACQNTSLPCKQLCFLTLSLFSSILSEKNYVCKKKKRKGWQLFTLQLIITW